MLNIFNEESDFSEDYVIDKLLSLHRSKQENYTQFGFRFYNWYNKKNKKNVLWENLDQHRQLLWKARAQYIRKKLPNLYKWDNYFKVEDICIQLLKLNKYTRQSYIKNDYQLFRWYHNINGNSRYLYQTYRNYCKNKGYKLWKDRTQQVKKYIRKLKQIPIYGLLVLQYTNIPKEINIYIIREYICYYPIFLE